MAHVLLLFIFDMVDWSELVARYGKRSDHEQPEPVTKTRTAVNHARRGILVAPNREGIHRQLSTDVCLILMVMPVLCDPDEMSQVYNHPNYNGC